MLYNIINIKATTIDTHTTKFEDKEEKKVLLFSMLNK